MAPSFVIVTSPMSSTSILSKPLGPNDVLTTFAMVETAVTFCDRTSCIGRLFSDDQRYQNLRTHANLRHGDKDIASKHLSASAKETDQLHGARRRQGGAFGCQAGSIPMRLLLATRARLLLCVFPRWQRNEGPVGHESSCGLKFASNHRSRAQMANSSKPLAKGHNTPRTAMHAAEPETPAVAP